RAGARRAAGLPVRDRRGGAAVRGGRHGRGTGRVHPGQPGLRMVRPERRRAGVGGGGGAGGGRGGGGGRARRGGGGGGGAAGAGAATTAGAAAAARPRLSRETAPLVPELSRFVQPVRVISRILARGPARERVKLRLRARTWLAGGRVCASWLPRWPVPG